MCSIGCGCENKEFLLHHLDDVLKLHKNKLNLLQASSENRTSNANGHDRGKYPGDLRACEYREAIDVSVVAVHTCTCPTT